MANAPPIFFYLRIFFGYCFEEGQIKNKYLLKDCLDIVNTRKKLKILPFMRRRIKLWWILAAPLLMLLAKLRQWICAKQVCCVLVTPSWVTRNELGPFVYTSLTRILAGIDAQCHWAKRAACRTIDAGPAVHTMAESCCNPAPHVHEPSAGLRMQGPYRTDARAAGTSDSSPVTLNLGGCRCSQLCYRNVRETLMLTDKMRDWALWRLLHWLNLSTWSSLFKRDIFGFLLRSFWSSNHNFNSARQPTSNTFSSI